ncbi:MAG: IS1595 family transposase [Desulfobaccales bacterium]
MNLSEIGKLTEEEVREHMEKTLWPNGPVCPHCGHQGAWTLNGDSYRKGLYKCKACKEPFTVTIGTIMEDSHLPIRKWLMAFSLMCASKKGISALQLQRQLGLGSYQTAWHLCHRIRLAMNEDRTLKPLSGIVEVDEAYIGGKPRGGIDPKTGNPRPYSKRGRGTSKTPVLALVERNGKAVSMPMERLSAEKLKGAIKEVVNKDSRIMTDEWHVYREIDDDFSGGHQTVNHSRKEFARGDVSTNTVESYFALLKRGIHGAFHHVSKLHLHRYCDEFSFRWNYRKVTDGERTIEAIKGSDGKRLMYKAIC